MVQIIGLKSLQSELSKREKEVARQARVSVIVFFQAAYALYVHEMGPGHKNPPKSDAQRRAMFASMREREKTGHTPWATGQPKFLEQPARTEQRAIARDIRQEIETGTPLAEALLVGALRLQRAAQLLCPVDTNELRSSAHTEIEK